MHDLHRQFSSFDDFQPFLEPQLSRAGLLEECVGCIRRLGVMEPLTGQHIRPEEILIDGSNYRESITAQGCQGRSRAVMLVLEKIYGNCSELEAARIYLAETVTGFARRLRSLNSRLVQSEYLHESAPELQKHLNHQDLTALTFSDALFDLVLVNEIFEHIYPLEQALREILRVLKPNGRLISTFPFAFGQRDSIVKAVRRPDDNQVELLTELELHGDPVRPEQGSMVFQIPGWDLMDQLRSIGFGKTTMHYICSWKHGVLGGDIAGVFVLEAQR